MPYADPENKKAQRRAYYKLHREETKARSRKWYEENKERALAAAKIYRTKPQHKKAQRGYQSKYREAHRDVLNAEENIRYHELASLEMLIVAQARGNDLPVCRADLTPELVSIPCRGALQIDHLNGGGHKERSWNRIRGVVKGMRALDDLRVLCELHQAAYAILRGDSVGGSDPKAWEDGVPE